ncbi:methyltransferase domain-containing protein [Legionella pneumophila serogroup 1]
MSCISLRFNLIKAVVIKFLITAKGGINIYEGVAESLPFATNQFDYILFNTVVCFLDSPQKAFSEAKRVLKSNGVLIIGMIDKNSPLGRLYETQKMDNSFYQNAHFYSVDELMALINQLGFSKKEVYQTIFSPLDKIVTPELVKPGCGEGGFVVIKAINRFYDVDSGIS